MLIQVSRFLLFIVIIVRVIFLDQDSLTIDNILHNDTFTCKFNKIITGLVH